MIEDPSKIDELARKTVEAAKVCGGIVVAVGGDGTISAVANAVLGSGCAFGALPQRTFNYFGRTQCISENIQEALQALLNASPHRWLLFRIHLMKSRFPLPFLRRSFVRCRFRYEGIEHRTGLNGLGQTSKNAVLNKDILANRHKYCL